jgi:hypothetical protein
MSRVIYLDSEVGGRRSEDQKIRRLEGWKVRGQRSEVGDREIENRKEAVRRTMDEGREKMDEKPEALWRPSSKRSGLPSSIGYKSEATLSIINQQS